MIQLFCIQLRDAGLIKIKISNEVSAVIVFKSREKAEIYIRDSIAKQSQGDCEITEFSFELFRSARVWADKSGIDLVLHIYDV